MTGTNKCSKSVTPISSDQAENGGLSTAAEFLPGSRPKSNYCYRHHPDLLRNRTVDEPTIDQLRNEIANLSQSDQQRIADVWSLFSTAPSKHRILMIQGILAQSCFPELSFISSSVRDLVKIDFLSALPTEISLKILCNLDSTSLCKAAQVSQKWKTLADDDFVWYNMCDQHIDRKCTTCGWGLPFLDKKRFRIADLKTPKKRKIPELSLFESCVKRNCTEAVVDNVCETRFKSGVRPWKEIFKDRYKIGMNWKYGRCSTKVFKGHAKRVMCLQFDDNILASGSSDTTIKIWQIKTGKELRTLIGHVGEIHCLQFDKVKLISGSQDRSLIVWNWRTGALIKTLPGHSGAIFSLHFDGTLMASGSSDRTIRIWNLETRDTYLLIGHTDSVNGVKVDAASRTVFSASDDRTIRIWDLDTRHCIKKFEGHLGNVQQILTLPHELEFCEEEDEAQVFESELPQSSSAVRPSPPTYMVSGALDNTIRIWSVRTGRCIRTITGHLEGVEALAADTLRLVSGSEDSMVRIWDPQTGNCERTISGHSGPVTCVGLSDSMLASGSEDCDVRLLEFGCVGK